MELTASKTARASMASIRVPRFESTVTPAPEEPLKPFVASTVTSFQSVTASADAVLAASSADMAEKVNTALR